MRIDYKSVVLGMLLGIAGTQTGKCVNDQFKEKPARQQQATELSTLVEEHETDDVKRIVLEHTGKLNPDLLKDKIDEYVREGLYWTAAKTALENGDKKQALHLYEQAANNAGNENRSMFYWHSAKILELKGETSQALSMYTHASRAFESERQYSLAAEAATDGQDFKRAMGLYIQAGDFLGARNAAEKLGDTENVIHYDKLFRAVLSSKRH
ncbi:MAG: hypothetical protein WC595_02550 [Candidatus Nanoarchaeia archaeon]